MKPILKPIVIIPTYNEVDNIDPLTSEIWSHSPGLHVCFVDDNSTDGTREKIAAVDRANPSLIHVIKRSGKLGLGTAYVAGFKWALEHGYDAIIEMDADLSHSPADLPRMIAALQSNDAVVGSRYVTGGGTVNWGAFRKIISRFGSLYGRLILGLKICDLTGGFNGWRRPVLEKIGIDAIRSEGYSFQIELKYRAAVAGFGITEMPIIFTERRAGQSKMSGWIIFEAMLRVWQLRLLKRAFPTAKNVESTKN